MPVLDDLELAEKVVKETTVRLSAVVVNGSCPSSSAGSEEGDLELLRQPETDRDAVRCGPG